MAPVNFFMNILWLLFGGILMGLGWCVAGLIMLVTIIGIPWARSCFVIAGLAFWPFGKMIVDRQYVQGYHDVGTGPIGLLGNVIWFVFAGWWLAVGHLSAALANFLSIIGIPFGIQHLKLALISLAPVGKTVVNKPDSMMMQ